MDKQDLSGVTLDDLLTPQQLDDLERLERLGRERWSASDFITVGGCGVIGLLATVFDDAIDAAVKGGLAGLGQSGVFQHFEQQGKQLPIDYTGPKFGGPGHRVRSPGHDIGRPFEALRQICDGTFTGTYWDHGQQLTFTQAGYTPHDLPEALVLWLMHLAADLVTTTSLPLPWWSELYECNSRDLRKLAHELYNPSGQAGLNVRSMFISKALPLVTTELVVGTKVHLDTRAVTGRMGSLSANERLKRNEMLLAGHACTGLAAIGKVAIVAGAGEGPLALRHLNVSAIGRAGFLGLKVVREYQARSARYQVPTWDDLLLCMPLPWQLGELTVAANERGPGA